MLCRCEVGRLGQPCIVLVDMLRRRRFVAEDAALLVETQYPFHRDLPLADLPATAALARLALAGVLLASGLGLMRLRRLRRRAGTRWTP